MLITPLKAAGILADFLTFSGSVLLAVDALLRQRTIARRRASVHTAKRMRDAGLTVIERDGRPLDENSLEDHESEFSSVLAWMGVLFLMAGFAILLVIRIVLP